MTRHKRPTKGHIALLGHGSQVEFRNLRIRENLKLNKHDVCRTFHESPKIYRQLEPCRERALCQPTFVGGRITHAETAVCRHGHRWTGVPRTSRHWLVTQK